MLTFHGEHLDLCHAQWRSSFKHPVFAASFAFSPQSHQDCAFSPVLDLPSQNYEISDGKICAKKQNVKQYCSQFDHSQNRVQSQKHQWPWIALRVSETNCRHLLHHHLSQGISRDISRVKLFLPGKWYSDPSSAPCWGLTNSSHTSTFIQSLSCYVNVPPPHYSDRSVIWQMHLGQTVHFFDITKPIGLRIRSSIRALFWIKVVLVDCRPSSGLRVGLHWAPGGSVGKQAPHIQRLCAHRSGHGFDSTSGPCCLSFPLSFSCFLSTLQLSCLSNEGTKSPKNIF